MKYILLLFFICSQFVEAQNLSRLAGTKWITEGANGGIQEGTLNFNKNNLFSFYGEVDGSTSSGKYKVSGDTLILNFNTDKSYDDHTHKYKMMSMKQVERYIIKNNQLIFLFQIYWKGTHSDTTLVRGGYGGDCIFILDKKMNHF